MFDSITLGPFGSPVPSIDAGLLAECLLFYRKVRVVTGASTFRTLVRTCGADELLDLCGTGNLEIEFLENMTAIASVETNVGVCHDMGLITGNASKFKGPPERSRTKKLERLREGQNVFSIPSTELLSGENTTQQSLRARRKP